MGKMLQEFRFQLAKFWKVWTESPWRNFVKVYCIVTVKEQVEGVGDALKRVQALPSLRTSFWLLKEETQQKVFKLYTGWFSPHLRSSGIWPQGKIQTEPGPGSLF